MSIRKRVSQACTLCASRKIKCDGVLPTCSPCQYRSDECVYSAPKRRKLIHSTTLPNTPVSPSAVAESSVARSAPATSQRRSSNGDPSSSFPSPAISAELSRTLFHTYFESIHPMWPLLYKPLYASSDYTYPSATFPDSLAMAIFTTASCIDRPRPIDYGVVDSSQPINNSIKTKVFFEETLRLLQRGARTGDPPQPINALAPSITSCQVLIILTLQQHGIAEYSRAAMLFGLASAMAIELRLNRPYELDDQIEREIRYRLWWNVYVLDKMISGEMSRPIILREEESDCPWPSVAETDEFELMSSHSQSQSQNSLGIAHRNTFKMRTISAFHTTISLSMIMERMYRKVYGLAARKAIRDDQAAGEQLRMQLWLELQQWERDIEASPLKLDLSDELMSPPAAVTNYVIMWTATILLHRPFIAWWRPNLGSTADPFEISLQAANQICQVLEKYLECLPRGPCDMIFSIFIAASILLQHSKKGEVEAMDTTRRRLKLCIHWLSVLGKSWKIAGERSKLLDDMFDTPQELQEPTSTHGKEAVQHAPPTIPLRGLPVSENQPNGQPQEFPPSLDDWSFLQGFGDSSDQFYAWDVDLRDLLTGRGDGFF